MTDAPLPRTRVAGRDIEWDAAAADYEAHRAPFPTLLVDLLQPLGVGREGEPMVDLATGVGTPALQFARRGVPVTGVDSSAGMLARAAARAAAESLPMTTVVAAAEDTGLPAGSARSVTVGQAWHWFDPVRATAEVARLLVPGGRIAICGFDWQVGAEKRIDATFEVLRRRNPEVVAQRPLESVDRREQWAADLTDGGFEPIASLHVRADVDYTPDAWRGRLRASTWVHATLEADQVAAIDEELADVLADAPPLLEVPHVLFVVVAQAPG